MMSDVVQMLYICFVFAGKGPTVQRQKAVKQATTAFWNFRAVLGVIMG